MHMVRLRDDFPIDEVAWGGGSKKGFLTKVLKRKDYRCESCGVTILETPLFVTATSQKSGYLPEKRLFATANATLKCADCGDGKGVQAGFPADEKALEQMRQSVEPELAGGAEDAESDVEARIVSEVDDEEREDVTVFKIDSEGEPSSKQGERTDADDITHSSIIQGNPWESSNGAEDEEQNREDQEGEEMSVIGWVRSALSRLTTQ